MKGSLTALSSVKEGFLFQKFAPTQSSKHSLSNSSSCIIPVPISFVLSRKTGVTSKNSGSRFVPDCRPVKRARLGWGLQSQRYVQLDALLYPDIFPANQTSVTKWVDDLSRIPLYAIISVFKPGDTPSVGPYSTSSIVSGISKLLTSSPTRPKRKKPKIRKNG